MNWVWTWSGKSFGYVDGEDLWTYDGRHVGKLRNSEIYGPDGQYLGEIQHLNRLLTNVEKKSKQTQPFTRLKQRIAHYPYADCIAKFLHLGHEDFAQPKDWRERTELGVPVHDLDQESAIKDRRT
jgi:hypothetical protein